MKWFYIISIALVLVLSAAPFALLEEENTEDLKGKIVLVVGGAGGIGFGIGKAFAAEGCKVTLSDTDEEGLKKAAKAGSGDSELLWRTCDITDRGQVSKLFQWIGDEAGPVDILLVQSQS